MTGRVPLIGHLWQAKVLTQASSHLLAGALELFIYATFVGVLATWRAVEGFKSVSSVLPV